MYYVIVATFMVLLPLVSLAVESLAVGASFGAPLIAKWFVFWSVGWRLLLGAFAVAALGS